MFIPFKNVLLDILNYLFKFTDFYSIIIIYIKFFYNQKNLNDSFSYLIKQFLLIILDPNPELRISIRHFILTLCLLLIILKI